MLMDITYTHMKVFDVLRFAFDDCGCYDEGCSEKEDGRWKGKENFDRICLPRLPKYVTLSGNRSITLSLRNSREHSSAKWSIYILFLLPAVPASDHLDSP